MAAAQAFRALAKVQHPDKGGDADQFGRLQRSFEILADPKRRAVYDTWAKELQFRYVRGVAAKVRLCCRTLEPCWGSGSVSSPVPLPLGGLPKTGCGTISGRSGSTMPNRQPAAGSALHLMAQLPGSCHEACCDSPRQRAEPGACRP